MNIRLIISGIFIAILGCSGQLKDNGADYDTSTGTAIASAMTSAATSSDGATGTPVSMMMERGLRTPFGEIASLFLPKAEALLCINSAKVVGTACGGASLLEMSIALGGCSILGGTYTGTLLMDYDSAGTCTNATTTGVLAMGNNASVTITTSGGPITRTLATGAYVTLDSAASGTFASVSGGIVVTCKSADCTTGNGRKVDIPGMHRIAYDSSGTVLLDQSYSTVSSLSITGTGTSRQISSGVVLVQHNLAAIEATSTVISPLTFTAGCCFPTGGTMSTQFTSGLIGSETMAFGPTCGSASVNGHGFTLDHCL